MTTAFDWIKLGLENSKVILPILVILLSATGYTVNDNFTKDQEIKDTQEQIANVANYYAKPIIKPVVKTDCCIDSMKSHEKEYH